MCANGGVGALGWTGGRESSGGKTLATGRPMSGPAVWPGPFTILLVIGRHRNMVVHVSLLTGMDRAPAAAYLSHQYGTTERLEAHQRCSERPDDYLD